MNTPYCENPNEPLRIQKVEDYRIAPHLHISTEIIFVEKGEAALTIGSLDYSLSSGDYALVLPNNLHSVVPTAAGTAVYVINCKQEVVSEVIRRLSGLRPASPVLQKMDVPELLSYAIFALTTERDKFVSHSLANLIANIIVSKLRFAEIHDSVTSDLTNRILTYLGIHFRESISLDQLAEVMNVSRFHLSHIFSGKLGIGFKEYLNSLRVECAKTMLRSTDSSISEICTEAGFENQRTFNRVFRELTGASPRDYRLHREDYGVLPHEVEPITLDEIPAAQELSLPNPIVTTVNEVSEAVAPEEKPRRKKVAKKPISTEIPDAPAKASDETKEDEPKRKKKEQAWFL